MRGTTGHPEGVVMRDSGLREGLDVEVAARIRNHVTAVQMKRGFGILTRLTGKMYAGDYETEDLRGATIDIPIGLAVKLSGLGQQTVHHPSVLGGRF
jgi:hypothetical protein